ncbi:caspase family protein [Candidatus Halobeggiatoa sp. HSG11]|nr:caspase family protein [Candidatus Halobeggiatoa sp. HSG11]
MFNILKNISVILLLTLPLLTESATIDEPILRINTDMHTDAITSIDIDANERFLVTGSKDKTIRVWSLPEEWDKKNLEGAKLEQVLRPPIQEGSNIGQINTVAISPDGKQIIAGGWEGCEQDMGMSCSIYIFNRITGRLKKRISNLPAEVLHLTFSPSGNEILATFGESSKNKGEGVYIYHIVDDRVTSEKLEGEYGGASYWGEIFEDPNNPTAKRIVTTCEDGAIRLYDKNLDPVAKYNTNEDGIYPYMARFHPSGDKIAVSLKNYKQIILLSESKSSNINRTFTEPPKDPIKSNSGNEINGSKFSSNLVILDKLSIQKDEKESKGYEGDLSVINWSIDGNWLYATGYKYQIDGIRPILRWYKGNSENGYLVWPSIDEIIEILPLKNDVVLFGAENPAFGIFDSRGQKILYNSAETVDFNQNKKILYNNYKSKNRTYLNEFQTSQNDLLLSKDATTVQFGYSDHHGKRLIRFSINNRILYDIFEENEKLKPSRTSGVELFQKNSSVHKLTNGIYISDLRLNNQNILKGEESKTEIVHSFSVTSSSQKFLIGTSEYLRFFSNDGIQQWETKISSPALQVNIARNDKVVVVILKSGTLRWYRLTDGEELLSLFPHTDGKRWILWTSLGYYDTSVGGEKLIGWHVNLGPNKAADFFSASQFRKIYYRPDVINNVLEKLDIEEALFAANQKASMKIVTPEIHNVLKQKYDVEVVNTVLQMFNIDEALHLVAQEMGYLSTELMKKRPIQELLPPVVTYLNKCDKPNSQRYTNTIINDENISFSNPNIKLCYRIRRPSEKYITALKILVDGRPLGEIRKEHYTRNHHTDTTEKTKECTSLPKIRTTNNQKNVTSNDKIENDTAENLDNSRDIGTILARKSIDCELPQNEEKEYHLNITLPQNDVELGLIVENKFAASDPVTINLNWTGKKVEKITKPNLYGLIVGVSEYDDETVRLRYAAQDAIDFSEVLNKQKELYNNIEIELLANADKARILEGLKWIRNKATINDVSILFFAGHGYNDNEGQYYFLPRDVNKHNIIETSVVYQQIKQNVTALPSKTLFFIDTCHSGNVMGGGIVGGSVDVDRVSNDLASSENGIVVFAAATGKQLAWENESWGNGAFTKALLEGLEGEADLISDGKIKFSELNTYLSDRVSKLTDGKQTPTTAIPKTIADFPIALMENYSPEQKKHNTNKGGKSRGGDDFDTPEVGQ